MAVKFTRTQADIQGYSASQLNVAPPSTALSGAASDIGADLGPDPRLVNSVDR
jgi:precorrin-3B methylase